MPKITPATCPATKMTTTPSLWTSTTWNHLFCEWGEWQVIEEGKHYLDVAKQMPCDNYEVQRRECKWCKKSQLRKVSTSTSEI